jgi:hypothetical protein
MVRLQETSFHLTLDECSGNLLQVSEHMFMRMILVVGNGIWGNMSCSLHICLYIAQENIKELAALICL